MASPEEQPEAPEEQAKVEYDANDIVAPNEIERVTRLEPEYLDPDRAVYTAEEIRNALALKTMKLVKPPK